MENWQSKSLNGIFKYLECSESGQVALDTTTATDNIVGNDEGQLTFPRTRRAQDWGYHPIEEGSYGQREREVSIKPSKTQKLVH